MSVYIQNMDIPNNCAECPIKSFDGEDDVCPFSGVSVLNIGRQASCPLVEAGSKLRQVVLCKECILGSKEIIDNVKCVRCHNKSIGLYECVNDENFYCAYGVRK